MATITSATRLKAHQASVEVASTHGCPAINPFTGDKAVIFSVGPDPQTIKVRIYRRIANDINGNPQWSPGSVILLASPTAAATPSGGGTYSCSHPWICPIEDGFFAAWERRDTTISNETMTAGGMQIEMAVLKFNATTGNYDKYASATLGKGFVLDNTVIAGDAGGTPRVAWRRRNQVGIVYGHQQTFSQVVNDRQRTWSVRAAYLDCSPNGKPTFIANGNRTGGSVSDATDGGYAAGPTATFLVQNIDLDDDATASVFAVGGGLPCCVFDMRGDFAVAYEVRNGAAGQGGIVMRTFKGCNRGTGLDAAAIYTSTADHNSGAAPNLSRRPILACRNPYIYGNVLTGANFSPILITYGNQVPGSPDSGTVTAKTITFPLNGAAPTIAALTVPANQNYDATGEEQSLPFVIDSTNFSAALVQEKLVNVSGGDGFKFKVVPVSGSGEIQLAFMCERPQRPNMVATLLQDGTEVAVLTYEGQDTSGSGSEHVYVEPYKLA